MIKRKQLELGKVGCK